MPGMNTINQDDLYLNARFVPGEAVVLAYESVSAGLDPTMSLEKQMGAIPGGAILILVGTMEDNKVVRNRIMWMYTMGCSEFDSVTVEVCFELSDPAGLTKHSFERVCLPSGAHCPPGGARWSPRWLPRHSQTRRGQQGRAATSLSCRQPSV